MGNDGLELEDDAACVVAIVEGSDEGLVSFCLVGSVEEACHVGATCDAKSWSSFCVGDGLGIVAVGGCLVGLCSPLRGSQ